MEQLDKSNFCIRPFNSVHVSSDGFINSCCWVKTKTFNIKNNTVEDFWKSDYLTNFRSQFLKNQKPAECLRCWEKEIKGLQSHRLKSNYEYKSVFKNKYEENLKLIEKYNLNYPEDIELNITNICNLSCQMCSGKDSSRLLIENNHLGFEKMNQQDYNINEKNLLSIKQILKHDFKLLNLQGGEPLINKHILKIIEKLANSGKSKNIKLHLTTNGTTCNNKIINLLKKFSNLRIMFSVESVGKYNDYMRYPSNWKDIEKNILLFKQLKNAYLIINTVVQNLNLLYLEPLIDFAHSNKIFLNFNLLSYPTYLEFDNMPLDLLKKSYEILCNIDKEKLIHTKNVKEIINLLRVKIDNYTYNENKFNTFKDMIKKRDQYRKISIADYMPEIHNII